MSIRLRAAAAAPHESHARSTCTRAGEHFFHQLCLFDAQIVPAKAAFVVAICKP
jgi:hypothetical protein